MCKKRHKMAPRCLINTYEDVHASIEGLTTSKVKKNTTPLTSQIKPLCAGTIEMCTTFNLLTFIPLPLNYTKEISQFNALSIPISTTNVRHPMEDIYIICKYKTKKHNHFCNTTNVISLYQVKDSHEP